METYAERRDAAFPEITKTSRIEIPPTGTRDTREPTAREPAALRSAIRLLGEASRVLSVSQDDARKFILRAAALLETESDLRDRVVAYAAGVGQCRLAPWQIRRVMRFIDANLRVKIAPRDLANVVHLSMSHFSRAFRATVGKSPHAYLIHQRIERAKGMMLETDLPLIQIALDCGFANQSHLTRQFTRIVGKGPAAWRRIHVPRPMGRLLRANSKCRRKREPQRVT